MAAQGRTTLAAPFAPLPAAPLCAPPADLTAMHRLLSSSRPLRLAAALFLAPTGAGAGVAGALALFGAAPVAAQPSTSAVPRIEEAESIFEQALAAYRERDFGMAYRRFRLAYSGYPLHQKTTAARLMAARARLREGYAEEAARLARDFVAEFPESRYAADARALLAGLGVAETPTRAPETLDIGLALPLTAETAPLTQAFFNGFRMAVDEVNAAALASGGTRIRMVFRDSRGDAVGAESAVAALASTAVIVGPLFSDEALAAGAAAERQRTVLIAPLATDDRVADGRRYVFQSNAPLAVRGAQMARTAQALGLRLVGVVSEGEAGGTSERLARGFADETRRSGGEVAVQANVGEAWTSLTTRVGAAALGEMDALYLPVSGGNAETDIRVVLGALDRASADIVVLGDAEWHNRPAARALGPRFRVTYTNDFYLDPARAETRAFLGQYRQRFGADLDDAPFTTRRLAVTGYDLGRMLLRRLMSDGGRRDLADALRTSATFEGIGTRVGFAGGQVNRALFVQRITATGLERLDDGR